MESMSDLSELSHLIQLAVAPVFLLTGVAGFLNVMAGRLGRIVDRHRVLQRRQLMNQDAEVLARIDAELQVLRRRIRLNNWSIGFCTLSGLMICMVVMTLFAGSYWEIPVHAGIVLFFVLAMLCLIVTLLLFIRETHLATRTLKVASEHADGGAHS